MEERRVLCAAKALILHDGKFLVLKQELNGKVFWDLPGGKVEFGESTEETVRREVMEEVHLRIENLAIFGTFSFIREKDGNQVTCITYTCTPVTTEVDLLQNPAEEDIAEYRWVTKDEFLTDAFPISASCTSKELIRTWDPSR